MPTCFVIQPFDKGAFDKRFDDVREPAIEAADLEPYRVDRDPGASNLMQNIEAGIRNAIVCLADITSDNPNVWFELGFAIASGKEVAMVCASSRQKFPFDVQNRHIIRYETESTSDFNALSGKITDRLKAILSKEAKIGAAAQLTSPAAPMVGLSAHELVALATVAQNLDNPSDWVSMYTIRNDMERAGFTRLASTLGLKSLLDKGFVLFREAYEDNTPYSVYSLSDTGMQWLLNNHDKLALTGPQKQERDIPF